MECELMNIQVFGTETCPNCKSVLNFLESKGAEFSYKLIGVDIDKQSVDTLTGRTVRSVPVIVVDGSEMSFPDLKQLTFPNGNVLEGLSI